MRALMAFTLFASSAYGQAASSPAGNWVSKLMWFDDPTYDRLYLELNGNSLTGTLGPNLFEGTFESGQIAARVKLNPRTTLELTGAVSGDHIAGTGRVIEQNLDLKWDASREPLSVDAPRAIQFEPTRFSHYFSDAIEPVLHIRAGDTVKTWSVDTRGFDSKGISRTSGGNPLTGPFYVEGAVPGDTLVVHFSRIRLNRDSAITSPLIVSSALDADYADQRKRSDGYSTDWKLDLQAGFAFLARPTDAMKDYKVPMAPMLGCVGVAPARGMSNRSGFLGSYGGNMDYDQLREGVTVYLAVNAPGALFFLGDGHAVQGAGELTGNALETSMDFEFSVDVKRGGGPDSPRMENSGYLMASGIAGSLDQAFRSATTNLVRWIEELYGLNAAEVSSVLGTAIVYDIAEAVDPQMHVVAKVPKSVTANLRKSGVK